MLKNKAGMTEFEYTKNAVQPRISQIYNLGPKPAPDPDRAKAHLIAGCIGKQPFSARMAKRVAKRSRAAVRAYKCPHCRMWHIGAGR